VFFPYDFIYPEQYQYMLELKRSLDAQGHSLIEMPTGTGKTITLLSLITSYQLAHPEVGKLIYCTRTVPEMEKALDELKSLIDFRAKEMGEKNQPILALGLSSRKNMCVNTDVMDEGSRESVDAKCRKLTASWVRERHAKSPEVPTCRFFENYEGMGRETLLDPGVYTLSDLREVGTEKGWCPYFLARHLIAYANVIVYNYQYMLDPKVAGMVSKELERECVVVFDEAHNIDNVCIEALSVNLRRQTLDDASRNLGQLTAAIQHVEEVDAERLQSEYQRLVQGLQAQGVLGGEELSANPVLPEDVLTEVPGNVRKAKAFVKFLDRFVQHLKHRLTAQSFQQENPAIFLQTLQEKVGIDMSAKSLRFCYERLNSLLKTLEITDTHDLSPITLVADFATLLGTYARGFAIIIEPFDERMPTIPDPIIQLACLDASLAVKPVFERFQSVVITSGTLSPIDLYPKILNFDPVAIASLKMTLTRECILPVVLTRGDNQDTVSTRYEVREDDSVIRSYGRMLIQMARVCPDGITVFFVSYLYMDHVVARWDEMGILDELMQHKLVFIETQDVVETTLALDNFRRACDCGRGAVFLSVARGKVSEGIDFDQHYGRSVIMIGVPYQYTQGRVLRARLEYLNETFQIKEQDFLTFDAVRQAAQCVGRVIRSKKDYGMMVFADQRYQRHDKRDKLPQWITSHLKDAHMNLSTDMLVHVARKFFVDMAQPYEEAIIGQSLLTEEQVSAKSTARAPIP
jgi:DNA excision repair protein ERCC-2